ncbi:MAG: helix-hairpin-helix domain-containing protein [Rhodanobacteraceae bacterium]|nr:helix-hairpin-helix domain-containing protein [Rhodanobacteraceae bacterium]MBK7042674.1 helix-hairpin-helix domain-containing protein [Rhodanobacteraceae bacterium]HQW81421.1 ComEA family DNA-binding protein [Pseudomonadota bacterium]
MNLIKSLFLALVLSFASFGVFAAQININTASAEQLTALNGIGDAKAAAIVEYRKSNGPFKSVDQLVDVKGIGLKLVEKNRDMITIGGKS